MALSDLKILEQMEAGNIVIDEFNLEQLNTSSYDVRLGEWYFRKSTPNVGQTIFSPYS